MADCDPLFRSHLRVFGPAEQLGSVRATCRTMGIHPFIYCRCGQPWSYFSPCILGRLPYMLKASVLSALLHHGVSRARSTAGTYATRTTPFTTTLQHCLASI
jgi:hypothetical protein